MINTNSSITIYSSGPSPFQFLANLLRHLLMAKSSLLYLKFLQIKLLMFVFFIFSTIPSSRSEHDKNFTDCGRPYRCGEVNTLSFPFWGGDRPQFCGHEGFELRCINNQYPVIDVGGLEYRIVNVTQSTNMMDLVRSDIWESPCSAKGINTTLDDVVFFSYPTTVANLTLLYNCSKLGLVGSFPNNFSCPRDNESISYYVYNNSQLEDLVATGLIRECRDGMVQLPVFRIVLDWIDRYAPGAGLEEVIYVLRQGFSVHYMDFPLCRECESSGGRCGSNTTDGLFICHCSGGATPSSCPRGSRDWRLKTIIGTISGGSSLLLICIIAWYLRYKSYKKSLTKKDQDLEDLIRSNRNLTARRYRFIDVKKMTRSFKDKLGQGGYGEVYKGKLLDGRLVAVKILKDSKGNGEEFINEVASISRTSHVNIVTLLGFCLEGHRRALIYEFMPNGSLEKFTYKDDTLKAIPDLESEKLLQISIGIARGLEYLHLGCNAKIFHLDIKPHNILLDEDFCPKISDFGLAKLCPRKDSFISMTNARGTIGYIAPEVFSRNFGGVSSKSDVYSYGMMILEMVGGKKNINVGVTDTSEIYFPDWIYEQLKVNSNLQLWGGMTSEENEIARKMILVGLWCIQTKSSDRPSMSKVIEMLNGSLESLHIPPNPFIFTPRSPERLLAETLAESSTTSML